MRRENVSYIQGADNKLGQFFNQDIYGTANHRNNLRHSLESCPSLVWRNVNKPSLDIKYVGREWNFCSYAKSFTRPHSKNHPVWLKASLKNHLSKEIWPPSSPGCDPLDYFMWCVFEREVSKCPHVTLTSLKVMNSAVVTDLDREVIIHTSMKFQSWIEVVMEATGVFIK